MIREVPGNFQRNPPKFSCDGELGKIPEPFPNNHFHLMVVGPPKSGKSSLAIQLLTNKKKNERVYHKIFHHIYVIQPELSQKSVKKDPFETLPQEQIYNTFDLATLRDIHKKVKENSENEETSLILIDDQAAYLQDRHKDVEILFKTFVFNKRHLRLSIINCIQRFYSMPKSIRSVVDYVVCFKPQVKEERNIIYQEFFDLKKNDFIRLCEYCFQDNHDHIFHKLGSKDYYRNFNKLEMDFNEHENF